MGEMNYKGLNKPYDSAFKSIIQKCPRLTLFLINEMFYRNGLIEKPYDGTERITLLNRELTDLGFGNREEDLRLKVETDQNGIFHLECESSPGSTKVMLRMVRYDIQTALNEVKIHDDYIRYRIDDSGVLFLRSTENTPSMVTVIVDGPQGSSMSYRIPGLKLQDYTMATMLEKKLFLLLPFLFFNYEEQIGKTADPRVYREMEALFDQMIQILKKLTEKEIITAYEASTLYDALKVVVEALGEKTKAEKEVREIMGGRVLEFSADKYYNDGKKKGWEEGRKEGREEGRKEGMGEGIGQGIDKERIFNIRNNMKKLKMTAEDAMNFMEIPVEEHSRYTMMLKEEPAGYEVEGQQVIDQ